MHELSVCQALLEQVAGVALERGSSRVSMVTVRLGPLSGVEPWLLKQAFTLARAGGVASDAELVIETDPVRIYCTACSREHETEANRIRCPDCGCNRVRLLGGDALILASVALETPGTTTSTATESGELHV